MDSSVAAVGGTRKGALFRSLAAVPAGGLVALVTITYTMSINGSTCGPRTIKFNAKVGGN